MKDQEIGFLGDIAIGFHSNYCCIVSIYIEMLFILVLDDEMGQLYILLHEMGLDEIAWRLFV